LAEQICTVNMDVVDGSQQSNVEWDIMNTGVLTNDLTVVQETFFGNGDISLPVELSFFRADYIDGVVEIKWRTESEFKNLGFYVYRSTAESGQYERRNPSLIKGGGSSATARNYKFVDERIENNMIYFYMLEDVDMDGRTRRYTPVRVQTGSAPVAIAEEYELAQNYPNPFNPQTTISFKLPHSEYIELSIYNIDGRLLRTIANGVFSAGRHAVVWNGSDAEGQQAPSGSYFCRLKTPGFQKSIKLTLIR